MNLRGTLAPLVLAVALFGCGKQQPRHIILMPDVSGSIDRDSLKQAFVEIDELASHLRRGDKVTIVPILGDAQAEASGRIIRFIVPTNRQAYESDLRKFALTLRTALEELKFSAMKAPGARTDILGSISLAEQEIRPDFGTTKEIVVILSDFIQDDGEVEFVRDRRLDDRAAAEEFARQMAKKDKLDFGGIPVYLGVLKSREFTGCSRNRRSAILGFWISYFTSLHAAPQYATDGLGLLKRIASTE